MGILSRRQNGGSAFVSAPASSCPPRFKFQWVSHGVHAANEPSLIALQSFTWPHQQRPHAAPKNYGRRKCHTCWGGRLNYVPSGRSRVSQLQPSAAVINLDPAIPSERRSIRQADVRTSRAARRRPRPPHQPLLDSVHLAIIQKSESSDTKSRK